jgi:glutathione S-transferase
MNSAASPKHRAVARVSTCLTFGSTIFPESGNSYKLALMLTLCGQTFDPIWTDFGGGVTRTLEWRRKVNEMGEIPVLEQDGKRLTQTAPILLQLAENYGRFGGNDGIPFISQVRDRLRS